MIAILARATCLACRRVFKVTRDPETDVADLRSPCCASPVEVGVAGAEEPPEAAVGFTAEA